MNMAFLRDKQQKKLFLPFAVKIKAVLLEMEKILRKTIMNTVDIIQKYFLKHPVYLKENVAFFL